MGTERNTNQHGDLA